MRKLLLALPLASLIFAAGCCTDETCGTCTASAGRPIAVASAPVKAGEVLTMEQYEKLVAEGKLTPASTDAVAAAQKAEPVVVAKAAPQPVVKEEKVAVRRAPAAPVASTPAGIRTIPGMALPEGWSYIHEKDLSGGKVNNEAEQFYSQVKTSEKADS